MRPVYPLHKDIARQVCVEVKGLVGQNSVDISSRGIASRLAEK